MAWSYVGELKFSLEHISTYKIKIWFVGNQQNGCLMSKKRKIVGSPATILWKAIKVSIFNLLSMKCKSKAKNISSDDSALWGCWEEHFYTMPPLERSWLWSGLRGGISKHFSLQKNFIFCMKSVGHNRHMTHFLAQLGGSHQYQCYPSKNECRSSSGVFCNGQQNICPHVQLQYSSAQISHRKMGIPELHNFSCWRICW